MIRVAIIDDHPLVGEGLAAAFAAAPALGVDVVALARSTDEVDGLLSATRPDVVLCDVMLDGEPDGLRVLRRIRRSPRPPAVVMLSSYDAPGFVHEPLAAGASGSLLKPAPLGTFAGALSAAAEGQPASADWLVHRAHDAPPVPTARNLDVIRAAASGRSNGEIATALGLTVKTVESYLHELYARYDVASRTELVMLAVAQGWLAGTARNLDPGA